MMLLIEPGIERLFTWDDAKNEINVKNTEFRLKRHLMFFQIPTHYRELKE